MRLLEGLGAPGGWGRGHGNSKATGVGTKWWKSSRLLSRDL
jgi:hypothetical protein